MKIHEFQAKEILGKAGVPVPKGSVAASADQACEAAQRIMEQTKSETVVVKAQIHAGGRGKGRFKEHPELGGVEVVTGLTAVRKTAEAMLGSTLVTVQTKEAGRRVKKVLVEQGLSIKKELYVGLTVDRASEKVLMMASTEGGTEIEVVAARTPEKIIKTHLHPMLGFGAFQGLNMAHALGLAGNSLRSAAACLTRLGRAFVELDASLLEVNPLVVTEKEEVIALDAKLNLDDNAAFRHKGREELRDLDEEDQAEQEGRKWNLSYINLDGTIGCMVNGAGLAMATMDIIKHHGGQPANFLDVGGGARKDQVAAAFKIITADPKVKGIFINIFGGIMRCDTIAEGVVEAVREVGLTVPLVIRLEGTNVELGRKILGGSDLAIVTASDMGDGARKIVELSR